MAMASIRLAGLQIDLARSYLQRLVGLLGRAGLAPDAALLLVPCNNVHTAFMRFAIDVVFLDARGVVLAVKTDVRPFRIALQRGAAACLELSSGGAQRHAIAVGAVLTPIAAVLGGAA